MWSTTASTVSTVAVTNEEYPVDKADGKVCKAKSLPHPKTRLDENWYRKITKNPFHSLLDDSKTLTIESDDLEIINQSNICPTLEQQNMRRKRLDHKLKVWQDPPCKTIKSFLTDYYNYPKLVAEIPGYQEIKAEEILSFVTDKGFNVIFINFSLGSETDHRRIIGEVKKARSISKYPIGLGIIISSHRLTTGVLRNNAESVYLDPGSKVILTADKKYSSLCSHDIIYGNFMDFVQTFDLGDSIKIGEHILVKVIGRDKNCLNVQVVKDGLLYSKMDLFLLNSRTLRKKVHLKAEEKQDINEAMNFECDFLILPCSLNMHILDYVKATQTVSDKNPLLFAKVDLKKMNLSETEFKILVERYDGIWLENFGSSGEFKDYALNLFLKSRRHILCSSDFYFSKKEKEVCEKDLAKMCGLVVNNFSEDFKNSIQKSYPNLNREVFYNYRTFLKNRVGYEDISCQYIRKIVLESFKYKASCIVIINESGKSVLKLSQARPLVPILTAFENPSSAQKCTVSRNVYPNISNSKSTSYSEDVFDKFKALVVIGKSLGFIDNKSPFVFCFQTEFHLEECDAFQILIEDDMSGD